MNGVLDGKTAIITGAGRGIGRALSLGFAQAGANVICAARTESEIESVASSICDSGGQSQAFVCDVTDYASVQSLFTETVRVYGGVDVLVVNAGVNFDRRFIKDSVPDDWVATIQVNLVGAYYCVQVAAQHMTEHGGQIIMMGSGLGHRAAKGRSAYAASKAGLWMLTRSASEDLWEHGVCVNELIPGPVITDMYTGAKTSATGNAVPVQREWEKSPEDVLPLALWLASNDRNGPTGQSFSLMRRDSQ